MILVPAKLTIQFSFDSNRHFQFCPFFYVLSGSENVKFEALTVGIDSKDIPVGILHAVATFRSHVLPPFSESMKSAQVHTCVLKSSRRGKQYNRPETTEQFTRY